MTRFVDIDLSGLQMPAVVENLDYEIILVELKADCVARMEADGIDYDMEDLESDPVVKVLQVAAYRELLLRARVNGAARAVMLAHAQGTDLDHLAAYYGVVRMVHAPATDDEPAVMEDDERLRRRVQLAPEAFATAGSEGAYKFHSLGVDASIKDVQVLNPAPGHVHVLPLTDTGAGVPNFNLLERIRIHLLKPDIKPVTDIIQVRAPNVTNFAVTATLQIPLGPDPTVVLNTARARLQAYLVERHQIGVGVKRSGIIAALKAAGVEDVLLASPGSNIEVAGDGVAYATEVNVTKAA